MVHFVGAGSGAVDLITVRGAKLLGEADVVIYAGSLVNPELLVLREARLRDPQQRKNDARGGHRRHLRRQRPASKTTVRLHTGDSSIYGAVREQFDELDKLGRSPTTSAPA